MREHRIDGNGEITNLGNDRPMTEPEDREMVMGKVLEDFRKMNDLV